MNNTCIILLVFVALVTSALSSYLEIPPPPERPVRFKTKEQIETYLKAVKDYYDAFKIKLVRRQDLYRDSDSAIDIDELNQLSRITDIRRRRRRDRVNHLMNNHI